MASSAWRTRRTRASANGSVLVGGPLRSAASAAGRPAKMAPKLRRLSSTRRLAGVASPAHRSHSTSWSSVSASATSVTGGAPQLVTDSVLDRSAKVGSQRAGLSRLEAAEPHERLLQRVLNQVARVDGAAHLLRQPAASPPPKPRCVPLEQRAGRRAAPRSDPLEEAPLRTGTAAVGSVHGFLRQAGFKGGRPRAGRYRARTAP